MAVVENLPRRSLSPEDDLIKALEEKANEKGREFELKRLQRDQRLAAVINMVTLARKHSGRSVEIASTSDASTIHIISNLLQPVANELENGTDPIFSEVSDNTLPSLIEFVIMKCAKNQSPSNDDVSRQSNGQPD